jgi:hypothetical protein
VFIIKKRVKPTDTTFQTRDRVTEFSKEQLHYAYKNRSSAGYNDYDIGQYQSMGRSIYTKRIVVKAIESREIPQIRSISKHFYLTSGIYGRVCRYLALLPTYDYLITPYVYAENVRKDRLLADFQRSLRFLDNMNLKTKLQQIALKVVVEGVYYGYVRNNGTHIVLQDLPVDWCRSLYKIDGFPVVEFNVRYFDIMFKRLDSRGQVLKSMPEEIIQGYLDYKENLLPVDSRDGGVWVCLNQANSAKFHLNDDDSPIFSSAIGQLIDFDDMNAIMKKKLEQQLLKIMVQKIPLDKNGEFIFDMEEAQAMHANAVRMLSRATNIDVLTTFADSELLDIENKQIASKDDHQGWERHIFNELGVSQQLFATEGNLALEKSVANDESIMVYLLNQIQDWLNQQLDFKFADTKIDYTFKVWIPRLTQHNREEMAKLYKDQAAAGYSKVLPAVALGQSQANVLATLLFENDVLKLSDIMVPIKMASTMSHSSSDKSPGRPEKSADEKSDKTLANEASEG